MFVSHEHPVMDKENNMHRTLVTVFAFSFTLAHAIDVTADDALYVEIQPGVSILADSDISGLGLSGEAEFDTGFVIGGALGYRIFDNLRAEANLSYRQADVDKVTSGAVVLEGAGDASVLALMANVYIDFDFGYAVKPYIGGGIGVGFIDVDKGSSNILIVDDEATEFAWNIMAGASYRVLENIDLSLGYRYLGTTDPDLDATLVGFGTGKLNAEITVHEVLFGLRYNF